MGHCCTNCGYIFQNGEDYYAVGDEELCKECLNDCKCTYEENEYAYEDYLTDKYELNRQEAKR